MKLRAIALAGALLWAFYLPSSSFAADSDKNKDQASQNPPPAATAEPAATKVSHDGGMNDLDAIGNRNVGCAKGMGNWYGLEKQIAMGKQISMQVESQSKVINDPVISEYINRLGQNLVRNSDSQVPFTIKVIDSDDINAFALPGGFFYVNSGLILAADEEAEEDEPVDVGRFLVRECADQREASEVEPALLACPDPAKQADRHAERVERQINVFAREAREVQEYRRDHEQE